MAIRKRTWVWKDRERSAWVVDYLDSKGTRRLKTFKTKGTAEDWSAGTRLDLKHGTHVADGESISVEKAAHLWLASCAEAGLERSTRQQYRQHVQLHIAPLIGSVKLNKLTLPAVRAFEDKLRETGRSAAHTRKVITSLGSIIADAQERGLAMRNPVRERKRRRRGSEADRHREKLEVGVHLPSPAEIRAILATSRDRWRAFVATAAMAGLRLSELRGLGWTDVEFARATVTVRRRADAWGTLGSPKAAASRRTIPVPPMVMTALKEWKLACPKGDLGLVFPNDAGKVESHGNAIPREWQALQVAAGVVVPALDESGAPLADDEGTPVMRAKYSGLHALRHFFCSWCAARKEDGGLGLPLKTVQVRWDTPRLP